jgi:hypothetical protein
MRYLKLLPLLALASCSAMPQFLQPSDETGVKIEVSKEAMSKKKDVKISVDVNNLPLQKG